MKRYPRLILAAAVFGGLAVSAFAAAKKPDLSATVPTAIPQGQIIEIVANASYNGVGVSGVTLKVRVDFANGGSLQLQGKNGGVTDNDGNAFADLNTALLPVGCGYRIRVQSEATPKDHPLDLQGHHDYSPSFCVDAVASTGPADTTPPTITAAAVDEAVECGALNAETLADWLETNGGATAEDNVGVISWTNNYTGLSGVCPKSATVTFTAWDAAGNSASTTATFTITDTTAPEITGETINILPSQAPITFAFTADDCTGIETFTIDNVVSTKAIVFEIVTAIDADSGSANGSFTLLESGGVGNEISFDVTATDVCGKESKIIYTFKILRPANEGVGNGVDGNTPGHDNNGGNDAEGTKPGSPGAKTKKK